MTDIGYETTCPKCGYCPKDTMNDNRHGIFYASDLVLEDYSGEGIITRCMRCGYGWMEHCQDRGQPKVLNSKEE